MKYIWQHHNWNNFLWDSHQLLPILSKARRVQGEILAKCKAFGVKLTPHAQAEILIEEAVKTSAVEGDILNRDFVRSLLWQGI